jgi:hypothetical protein
MWNSNNGYTSANGRKRKRLPIFSISLVACYLVVAIIFFAYGFGEGRSRPETVQAPPTAAPVTTPTPPVTTFDYSPEPIADDPIPLPPPVQVRGIWVGAWYSSNKERMDNYIKLIEESSVFNTIVLDVKEEHGHVTFLTDNEAISGTARDLVPNIAELVADMKDRGIYTIARVVCFKDSIYSFRNPELSIRDAAGSRWTDRSGNGWLNAYDRRSWDYIAEICMEAARLGFDEIQLDYVRFPVEGRLGDISFGQAAEVQTKTEVIAEFVGFIRETMNVMGVRVSADVFAITGLSERDSGILGQDFRKLIPNLDAISPMIYPSHFSNEGEGAFGNGVGQVINGELFTRPALEPHGVVYNTLQHFKRLMEMEMETENRELAVMRPYLQASDDAFLGEGFFMPYGVDEILAQIQAVYDAGFHEWLLWNNTSNYSDEVLKINP